MFTQKPLPGGSGFCIGTFHLIICVYSHHHAGFTTEIPSYSPHPSGFTIEIQSCSLHLAGYSIEFARRSPYSAGYIISFASHSPHFAGYIISFARRSPHLNAHCTAGYELLKIKVHHVFLGDLVKTNLYIATVVQLMACNSTLKLVVSETISTMVSILPGYREEYAILQFLSRTVW